MNSGVAPILLFNDECAVCRTIGAWVRSSAQNSAGPAFVDVWPIGDDPTALEALHPGLSIWDAYETIHILMPDGTMKIGGEAVAEVFRRLPNCAWFAWICRERFFGVAPFQAILNLGYLVLSDIRPLLGCESCGIPSPPVRWIRSILGHRPHHTVVRQRSA